MYKFVVRSVASMQAAEHSKWILPKARNITQKPYIHNVCTPTKAKRNCLNCIVSTYTNDVRHITSIVQSIKAIACSVDKEIANGIWERDAIL